MLKQVAVASATASLLITMATPAFAAPNEERPSGNRVRIHRSINERQNDASSKRNFKNRSQGKRETVRKRKVCTAAGMTEAQQKALKDARATLEAALQDARETRDAAFAQAKTLTDVAAADRARAEADQDYREAREEAMEAFHAERAGIIKAEE